MSKLRSYLEFIKKQKLFIQIMKSYNDEKKLFIKNESFCTKMIYYFYY